MTQGDHSLPLEIRFVRGEIGLEVAVLGEDNCSGVEGFAKESLVGLGDNELAERFSY